MSNPSSDPSLHPQLQNVSTSVLEGLGQLASYFGFNKVMGQLFGALLLSPTPLSLDDLMARLSISKASVSMNMRALEQLGIVREAWVKDDRRKYYRAEHDFWRIVTNVLSSRELRDVNQALSVLEEHIDHLHTTMSTLNADEQKLAEYYITRIDQLQDFFRLAQLILMSLIQQAQNQPDIDEIKRLDFQ